ncbi:MAG: DUF2065 domain-containing protein [Rhodospirillales bacterium]
MSDLIVALALAVALEGMAYALFPDGMRRLIAAVLDMPGRQLRAAGLFMAAIGVFVVWIVRG